MILFKAFSDKQNASHLKTSNVMIPKLGHNIIVKFRTGIGLTLVWFRPLLWLSHEGRLFTMRQKAWAHCICTCTNQEGGRE